MDAWLLAVTEVDHRIGLTAVWGGLLFDAGKPHSLWALLPEASRLQIRSRQKTAPLRRFAPDAL